jgi:hypothetical protein
LPDSLFYPVKLTTEQLLINFSQGTAATIRVHINLANVRLGDITTMQARNRLGLAAPAFVNYDYHVGSCLRLWQTQGAPRDPDLARLLYASSVAGEHVFASIGQSVDQLPDHLRANLEETADVLQGLNTSTGEYLQQAGFDLGQVLQTTDAGIARFLTPVPGVPTPAPTPEVTSSQPATVGSATPPPTLLTTPVPVPAEPTLTAVLWSAQTAIAEGGDSTTPVIAAAETVIAGGSGTPMAQAIQTLLAHSSATPALSPSSTAVPTITPPATGGPPTLTVPVPAQPGLTPGVPVTPPGSVGQLTTTTAPATSTTAVPSVPPATPTIAATGEVTTTMTFSPALPPDSKVPAPGVPTPELPLP